MPRDCLSQTGIVGPEHVGGGLDRRGTSDGYEEDELLDT